MKKTILIVDDSKMIRLIIRKLLDGYKEVGVDEAENGVDALNFIKKNRYDLIFLDLHMPGIDGFEVLQSISKPNNTKIITLSADIQEGAKEKAISLGADDFLTKPFENKDIENLIRNIIDL